MILWLTHGPPVSLPYVAFVHFRCVIWTPTVTFPHSSPSHQDSFVCPPPPVGALAPPVRMTYMDPTPVGAYTLSAEMVEGKTH